ncbi:hypothetical protein Tco_0418088 [Tanacetum coccineum]
MTDKINTVLKAITDRTTGAVPSNTVKNPKLNVNSTFLVLSARSYLTEDPQCSAQTYGSISDISICPKQPDEPQDNESMEQGDPENTDDDPSPPLDPSIALVTEKAHKLNSILESFSLVPNHPSQNLLRSVAMLVDSNRIPEVALMARSYLPSKCMSTRSTSSNLFYSLRDPESLIRHRNLGEPSSLFDFEETMSIPHNHQGPPPAGPPPPNNNGPPPVVRPNGPAPRSMEELCQPSINGRGRPIAPIPIRARILDFVIT